MKPPPLSTLDWHYLREAGDSGVYVLQIPSHSEMGPHDHVFYELVYIEAGTVDHETVDGMQKLRPGDIIVIRPQVWHAYRRPRSLKIINCLIDAPLMQRMMTLLGKMNGAFDLLRRRSELPQQAGPFVLHAGPAERAVVTTRLETIMAEQRTRPDGWQAACAASLLDLLVTVIRLSPSSTRPHLRNVPPAAIPQRTDDAVLDTAAYLEEHFTEAPSLEELAQRVNLSSAHLSRSFARRMGMGIVAYVHRMRAEEACRLLRCTDTPVGQIATRVGYDEIAYFSRCFRTHISQSPREYRRAWHGEVPRSGTPQ